MESQQSKYFFISGEKEIWDSKSLTSKIGDDKWVNRDTILVNCSPDYSSSLTQMINHRLSVFNDNELFEVINMEMPFPTFSQIWNPVKKEAQNFDSYLREWITLHLRSEFKYLFIDSGVLRGKNFNKVHLSIRQLIEPSNYRFASVYKEKSSIFTPDYFVQEFDQATQGGLLYWWENVNNPNWNY